MAHIWGNNQLKSHCIHLGKDQFFHAFDLERKSFNYDELGHPLTLYVTSFRMVN
jgi:hypothetical protein